MRLMEKVFQASYNFLGYISFCIQIRRRRIDGIKSWKINRIQLRKKRKGAVNWQPFSSFYREFYMNQREISPNCNLSIF